jgi:phosphoribosylanthranilate isomerase
MNNGRTRVKICGMTHAQDVDLAIAAGADAVGFIFAESPRRLTPELAAPLIARVPPFVQTTAVFVDPDPELYAAVAAVMPRMLPQFCGTESAAACRALANGPYLKVFHVNDVTTSSDLLAQLAEHTDALPLFDTKIAGRGGGSGIAFDWSLIENRTGRFAVAGGLNPDSVGECIRRLRPYAVDSRSGVEHEGRKDAARLQAFFAEVRKADREIYGQ